MVVVESVWGHMVVAVATRYPHVAVALWAFGVCASYDACSCHASGLCECMGVYAYLAPLGFCWSHMMCVACVPRVCLCVDRHDPHKRQRQGTGQGQGHEP